MNKILLSSVLASAVLFSACEDNLDIEQKGVTEIDNFYQTDNDAEQALVAAYQGFLQNSCSNQGGSIYCPSYLVFNLCGDDVFAAGSNLGDNDYIAAMNEFRYNTDNAVVQNAYKNYYYAIRDANFVIDKFKDGLPNVGHTETTKRVVAEARVLRAYIHMMLAIGWKNPPKVDHVRTLKELPLPQNCDHEELLKWCAAECEAAEPDLNERKSPTDKEGAAKVTKGLAWAIEGKCYLFLKDYEKCKTALKKVIDSKKYELVPGTRFADNFHVEGDLNEEKIFEANFHQNPNVGDWSNIQRSTWMQVNLWNWRSDHMKAAPNATYVTVDGWGGCGVPMAFAKEFIDNDGLDSYRLKASIVSVEDAFFGKLIDYDYDTGKKDAENKPITAKVSSLSESELNTSNFIGINNTSDGLYGQSLYLPLKPLAKSTDLFNPGNNKRNNNYVVMRYAEVLLMYAEACVMTNKADEAKKYVNMIQTRAGSNTISDNVDLDVIKKEKKLELWLEGNRWPDMVRWGDFALAQKAGTEVTKVFDKVFRKVESGDQIAEEHDRFYSIYAPEAKGRATGFQSGKHEYFPIPQSVLSLNPDLQQNTGWE